MLRFPDTQPHARHLMNLRDVQLHDKGALQRQAFTQF